MASGAAAGTGAPGAGALSAEPLLCKPIAPGCAYPDGSRAELAVLPALTPQPASPTTAASNPQHDHRFIFVFIVASCPEERAAGRDLTGAGRQPEQAT